MFIAVEQFVDTDVDIDAEQLEEFLDAFIALVESFGYTTGGTVKLTTDNVVCAAIDRATALHAACTGLTTEQLERCGEGGVQALVEALEAAVKALDYAARYYLLESAAAEMYAHCNGYADSPNAFAALAPFAGDTEGVE